MIKDSLKGIIGDIEATLYDEDGNVKQHSEFKNLVVATGKSFIASRMVGTATGVVSHMAVGSSGTAPADGNTTLVSEITTGGRASASGNAVGAVVTYTATFGAGVGTGTILECGLFNASTAGTMVARSASINVVKGPTDTLSLTWTITLSV